jgi:hypothetical protein
MARRQQQTVFAAIPQEQQVRPAFTVKKLTGTVSHRVHLFDKEKNKILSKVVQEPAGYLVTFYKGHSIRCRDEAHLRRVGAHLKFVPLIDKEGEVKGAIPNIDIPDDEVDENDNQDMEVVEQE